MKTRIIASAVLLPIFFAILFVFPPIVLTIVVSIITAIAAYELLHATKMIGNKRVLVYTMTSAALVPIMVYLSEIPAMMAREAASQMPNATISIFRPYSTMMLLTLIFSIFFIFISLLVIEAILAYKNEKAIEKGTQLKFKQIPIALAAGIAIPWMLSALISLKTLPAGHLLVLLPIVSTFLTDSGAYFTGVAIGKRKVLPTISPNKTLEGFIGGIIIGTFGLMIYGIILSYTTDLTVLFPVLLLYGIVGSIKTEFGDLFFSYIKRKCGIKDYGKLIPGHGGILDRFDSMIFNAPAMCVLMMFLPAVY